ncbi:ARM repeat superfamily protein [Klebsormidium nitens]|uniref:ARM repeat superfamily protein n=1 Tax=Klebsormidium nitens TaxID=105231 RepID=A0A1Y1HIZ3_KLENI|nr:ARM repeat superfamily protein [Klebsormidium nitens]|eukprot:GAQ78480.1 ARM repeat superfamily protein [Klebsormidium nitens]
MDPRYQMMRGQGAGHPLLEFPSDDELRAGTSSEGMMPEVAHNLVDPSLYMEAAQLHDPTFHPQAMFNPESPFHQLLPNSPAPGNGALLPAEYFDSLLNAYGVGLDPRQMAEARLQSQGGRQSNPAAFLHDGGLDVLAAETPRDGNTFPGGFGHPGSNSPVDMYGALQRFAASFATSQGGLGAPVATPRQLAAEEPSPYPPPRGMEMNYTTLGHFPEADGASHGRTSQPPEQGFNSRVLTSAACITAMIQKLRSPEDGVRREAMQAIRMWAGSSLLHQRAVAAAGAIPPLVDVLRTPSSTVVWVEAAQTLASLAINNEENKASIGLAGAIPPLVNLLGLPSREAREAAVGGLSCLARNEHNKQAIMDAGAVTGLVRMLTDGDNNSEFGREAAANVLAKLAVENDANKKAIGQYGAIPFLIRMVEHGSAKEQEVAAGALANLIQDPQNALELVGAGGVEALSELLDCPWEGARQAASAALTQVSVHEAKWNEEFNLLQAQGLEDGLQPVDDEDELTMDEVRAAEEILRNAINDNGGEEDEDDVPPEAEPPATDEVGGERGEEEDQPDDVSISEAESSDEDVPLVKRRGAVTSQAASARAADVVEGVADITKEGREPPEDVPLAMRFRVPLEEAGAARRRKGAKKQGRKQGRKKRVVKIPEKGGADLVAEEGQEKIAAEGGGEAKLAEGGAEASVAEASEQSSEEDVPLGMRKRVMSEEDLPILAKGLKPLVLDESIPLGVGVARAPKRRKLELRRAGSGDVSSRDGSESERPKRKRRRASVAERWDSEERASADPLDEEPAIRAALHSPVQATMTELLGMEDPPEGAFEDALAGEGHVTEKGSLDEALLPPGKEEEGSDPAGWDVVRSPDDETESPEKEKKRRRGSKKRAKPMQPPLKVSADVLRKPELQLSVPEFSAEKADAETAQCDCIGATAGVHNGDCQFRSPVGKPPQSSAAHILASGGSAAKPEPAKPKAPLAAGLSRLIVAFAAGLNSTPPPLPPMQPLREPGRKPRGRTGKLRPAAAVPDPPPAVPGLQQGLPALMGMLRSTSLESQEFGCLTVALLAVQGGDAAKRNMVEGGIVPALISIVRSAEAGRVSQLLRGGGFFPLAGKGGQVPGQSALGGGTTVNGRPRKRRNAFTNVGADGFSRPPPEGTSPAPARLLGPDLLPPSTNYQGGGGFQPATGGFSGPDLLPPGTHTLQQSLGPPSAAAAAARHIGLDLLPPGTSVTQFGPSGVRYRLPVNAMLNRNGGVKKAEHHPGGPNVPGRMLPGGKLLKPKAEPTVREAGVGTGAFFPVAGDAKRRVGPIHLVSKQPVQSPGWTSSQPQSIEGTAQARGSAPSENGVGPNGTQSERSRSPEQSQIVQSNPGSLTGADPAPLTESAEVKVPNAAEVVDLTKEAAATDENSEKKTGSDQIVAAATIEASPGVENGEVSEQPTAALRDGAGVGEQPTEGTNVRSTVAQSTASDSGVSQPANAPVARPEVASELLPEASTAGEKAELERSAVKTDIETDGSESSQQQTAEKPTNGISAQGSAQTTGTVADAEGLTAQQATVEGTVPETEVETVPESAKESAIPEREGDVEENIAASNEASTGPDDVTAPQNDVELREPSNPSEEITAAVDPAPAATDQITAAVDQAAAPDPAGESPSAPPSNLPSNTAVSSGSDAVPAWDGSQSLIPRALSTNAFSQALASASESPPESPDKANPRHLAALARIAAANALSTLCVGNPAGKDAAVRAGGVQALAIMAALAQGEASSNTPSEKPRESSETRAEASELLAEASDLSEKASERAIEASERRPNASGRRPESKRARGARNAERAAALSALTSLALSDGPQKQRMSSATAVPWVAKMMEGADALEVAAGAGGLQSIAASLDLEKMDEPAVSQDAKVSAAKHMPLELAFTLMELIAGGAPETRSAAIQALASFLIVRQDLASKLGGFGGLGGAYFGLHEQLRQAGRAGARALLSLLGTRSDAAVRESAVAAVAAAAAGSRRLLGWLEEEGVAPALMGIFRSGGDELMRALVLAAAFNVGALKGKLTGMGGEDVRSLVEYLKTEPETPEGVPEDVVAKVEVGAGTIGGESKEKEQERKEGAGVKLEMVESGLGQEAEKLVASTESRNDAKADGVDSAEAVGVSDGERTRGVRNADGAGVEEGEKGNTLNGPEPTEKSGDASVEATVSSVEQRSEVMDKGKNAPPETVAAESIECAATDPGAASPASPEVSEAKGEEASVVEPPRVASPESKGEEASVVEPTHVAPTLKTCKVEPEDGALNPPESATPSDPTSPQAEKHSDLVAESGHVASPSSDAAGPSDETPREPPVAAEMTSATGATSASAEQPAALELDEAKEVVPATNDVTAVVARPEAHVAAVEEAHVAPSPKPPNPATPYDHAAGVLVYAALGCDANGHLALVGAGGIPLIMKVLTKKGWGLDGPAREAAAAALMMLAASSEQTSREIRAAGGVAPLVKILGAQAGGSVTGGKVWGEKEAAAAALVVLAGRCEEGRNALIRAGGVRALVAALQCSEPGPIPPGTPTPSVPPGGLSPTGTAAIAQLLSTLAVHHPEARSQMASLGVLRPLVDVLMGGRRSPGGKEEEPGTIAQEAAAAALANIVQGDPASAREVVGAGAIAPLVRALEGGGEAAARARGAAAAAPNPGGQLAAMTALASLMRQMKETAALVLTELATEDGELQETVGGSGTIAVLVGMLNGPGKGKLAAARALSILTSRSEANKHRARNAGADVSVLSTLKFPGQTEPPGASPEKLAKTGPQPPGGRPTYQGARQPLTQVPGGAPRAVNGPGKFSGGRMISGFGGWGRTRRRGARRACASPTRLPRNKTWCERFAPGVKSANGPGRPPGVEMSTQAQSVPVPEGRNPAGMGSQTQPATAQVKVPVAEVGLQVSAQIPPGGPTQPTETGAQGHTVLNRGTVKGPADQAAVTERRPMESGPKATAEMGCQGQPLPVQPRPVATELSEWSKVQMKVVADVQPKPLVAIETVPKATPAVTEPPKPAVNQSPATNPAPDPVTHEISRPSPMPNMEENLANRQEPTKAFPDEAARAPATSADVDGAPRMTSAARAGSDLSLQMLAEVTAAAEAERELERTQSEVKLGSTISGGTKRARGEAGARPPLAEGTSSGGAQQRTPVESDGLPRPPKKPRTGMHRTPSKLVAERFPSFAEDAKEQQGQLRGGSPGSDEAERKDRGNETASERGRRTRLRGPPQRLG